MSKHPRIEANVRKKIKLADNRTKVALFTPKSTGNEDTRHVFSGFRYDERSTRENMLHKRVIELKGFVREMLDRLKTVQYNRK